MINTERMEAERKQRKLKENALLAAKERMVREGYAYPSSIGKTPIEHHDAILVYSQRETAYMLEFLKAPSGPRPIISYPEKKDWQAKYD